MVVIGQAYILPIIHDIDGGSYNRNLEEDRGIENSQQRTAQECSTNVRGFIEGLGTPNKEAPARI